MFCNTYCSGGLVTRQHVFKVWIAKLPYHFILRNKKQETLVSNSRSTLRLIDILYRVL